MKNQIINYIRAGYPGVYIVSSEETRVEAQIKSIAETIGHNLHAWSVTEGLADTKNGNVQDAADPTAALGRILDLPEDTMTLLRDFHTFLDNPDPFLIRGIKDTLRHAKATGKTLLLVGCRQVLPTELERELVVIPFDLPIRDELGAILDAIAQSANREISASVRELCIDSASGLTSIEAENAFALSVVESGGLTPDIVAREKAREVKKNGLLEVCPEPGSLDAIGGLDLLKQWLVKRRDAFGQEAIDYGLPSPKGLLIVGIPGTGKSLTAKATAGVLQRPLLRLDAGRLFGGLVGQSEANLRSVIVTVEAIAPCVLWVDEIEKGFAGSQSSNASDGGTASRVFGSFISWMQEKSAPVFVVATANDVSQLPPEFLRKGRFDEIFSIDLPDQKERETIWRLQITKYARDPDKFDINRLAAASDGMTGAEIEQAFIDALYDAFSRREEPADLGLMMVLGDTVPLSRLMSERIAQLRAWAKGRTRPASSPASEPTKRKISN